jgi:hypothetical protein
MELSAVSIQPRTCFCYFWLTADSWWLIAPIQKQPFLDGHWFSDSIKLELATRNPNRSI